MSNEQHRPKYSLYIFLGLFLSFVTWWVIGLRPSNSEKSIGLRVEKPTTLAKLAVKLEHKGVVVNSKAFWLYATFLRRQSSIAAGYYEFPSYARVGEVADRLKLPEQQMVRIPEGWWIKRVAKKLEEKRVCTAQEYIDLASHPALFQKKVSFQLPENLSLEGYLYPDTYDLPAGYGAKKTIQRQLQGFEKNILPLIPKEQNLHRILIIASMVELEASTPEERSKIAGIIENRLKKEMRLQFCVSSLYSMQEWKELKPGEAGMSDSAYNTYRHKGLPPGPLCSPTIESVQAALHPAKHEYLFFVAKPEGGHAFSKTFNEHLKHIRRLREHLKRTR